MRTAAYTEKLTDPFLPAQPGPFRRADGKTVTVQQMTGSSDAVQVRRADGWTSATLPYQGGELQAVVLLPPTASSSTACAALTARQVSALTDGLSVAGQVDMPKLHLSQTSQLAGDLEHLGLSATGYPGFGAAGSGISQVVQKTVLDVDENGTKAAAATGISIGVSARVPLNVVTVDRPYLLLIQDTKTHTPLFLARIGDPTTSN
jgi:serpin B